MGALDISQEKTSKKPSAEDSQSFDDLGFVEESHSKDDLGFEPSKDEDLGFEPINPNPVIESINKFGNAIKNIPIGDITAGEAASKRGKSDLDRVINEMPDVTIENIKESFQRGNVSAELDQASYLALTGTLDYDRDVKPLKDHQEAIIKADPIKGRNWISEAIYGTAAMLPAMGAGIVEGAATGSIAGGAAAAGTVTAPLAPALFSAGTVAGSYEYWRRQGAGQLYAEMKAKDIPDHISKPIAHIGGAMYSAIEFSQVDKLIPNLKETVKPIISDSLNKTIGKMAIAYGKNWVEEVGEEGLQQIVQSTAEEVAGKMAGTNEKPNTKIIQDILVGGWKASRDSALSMLLIMTPSAATGAMGIASGEKIKADVRKEMVRRVIDEATAQEIKEGKSVIQPEVKPPETAQEAPVKPSQEGTVKPGQAITPETAPSTVESQDKGLKTPATEVSSIPELKNTEQANIYGDSIKNKPEEISKVRDGATKIDQAFDEVKSRIESGKAAPEDQQQMSDLAFKGQLLRESLTVAEGTGDKAQKKMADELIGRQKANETQNKEQRYIDGKLHEKRGNEWVNIDTTKEPALPKTVTGYQGRGKSKKEIYAHTEYPAVGKGEYWAFRESDAKNYGDTVTKKEIPTEKLLHIKDDVAWRKLTDESGNEFPNPIGLSKDEVIKWAENIKATVQKKGYEGILITVPEDEANGKTLQNMFGHSQAVVYSENQVSAPASSSLEKPSETIATPAEKTSTPTKQSSGNLFDSSAYPELSSMQAHLISGDKPRKTGLSGEANRKWQGSTNPNWWRGKQKGQSSPFGLSKAKTLELLAKAQSGANLTDKEFTKISAMLDAARNDNEFQRVHKFLTEKPEELDAEINRTANQAIDEGESKSDVEQIIELGDTQGAQEVPEFSDWNNDEIDAGSESKIIPSGSIRPELQPPIPTELFQEKGELFSGPTQGKGSSGASVGSFTEEIANTTSAGITPKEAQIRPLATIEMIKLARLLMGEFPTLKRFPKARGMFYGQGNGSIKFHPDLFKIGNEKQLAATIAHEIGHLVDYLPDQTLKRGNVLGRLASLMNFLKTTLPKLESQLIDTILKPNDRSRIRRQAESKVGPRPEKDNEADLSAWQAEVSHEYAEMIIAETENRGLIAHKDLRDEMIRLSFEWRPIGDNPDPAYLVYRNSSKELYADAMSALLNNPDYVKTKAPLFYEMFFEYIDRKPEFKKQYLYFEQIMQGKPSDLAEIRMEDRRMMFAKGEEIRTQLDKEAEASRQDTWQNIRQLLDDRFYPITKRLNRGERDAIVPSSEAVHLLREQGMWKVDAYKYTQQIDKESITPMLETGATTQDLGDYQYLRRVIGKAEIDKNVEVAKAINSANEEVINALRAQGYEITDNLTDREQLANPLGYSPESARQALDYLKSKLTPEQWNAIEAADKKYRDITFKIVEEAVSSGVYSKKVFDEIILPNRDTYASFGVLDYITDNVSAGIKSSKGTLKEIENPFITTTLKTISLIRLIARNKATKATIEELNALYPGEMVESKKMYNAAGSTGYMRPPAGRGQVKYLVDGKLVSFDVDPYIAKSFENDDTQIIEMAAAFNKWSANSIFRNLVITFNPAFQAFNTVRDFGRSYVNVNALLSSKGESASIADILRAYYDALPLAIKHNMGISDPMLDEMMAHKVFGIPFNDYNVDDRNDGFARILRKYKVIGENMEAKTVREKLVKGLMQVDSAVRFVGNIIEALPKVAGYNILKERGISDRDLGYVTRTYIGTPDNQTTGKWSRLTNQIFTFSNITIQGAKSDIKLAINPTTRAGWHYANFKISTLPMLLMAAAILGFMGKELEDWFEKVPEFDKTNYIIVPLGVDDDGRARYARVPHNQTSRIFTALLYKVLTSRKNKVDGMAGAIDITASQLPSLAPILTTLGAWGAYLQGQNPQDMFRGRDILSERAYTAGGFPALSKMVQYTFNNYGFSQFTTYDDRRNTTFEAVMQGTPFVSALTRIIKTTDYGLVEKTQALSKEAKKETAQRNIERINLFDKQLKGYSSVDIGSLLDKEGTFRSSSKIKQELRAITDKLYDGKADKEDYKTTEKAFVRYSLKEYGNPWIKGFLSAQSNEDKLQVLIQAQDSLATDRYNEIVNKLKRARLISSELQRDINKASMRNSRP